MRSALVVGWMAVALLGFVVGSWLNLSPEDSLAKVGAGLYALLLVATLAHTVLGFLRQRNR